MKKVIIIFLLSISILSAQSKPKYIFFFIGDGFGLSHRQVTEYYKNYILNKRAPLIMNTFEEIAIYKTESYDSLVTDSAASGTAMASGVKTKNDVIGKDHRHIDVTNLARLAFENNMSAGIVTNTRITHATPASFSANVKNRDEENEIAMQQVNSKYIQFFAGGGLRHFVPKNSQDIKSARKDNYNLLNLAEKNGFTTITDTRGNIIEKSRNANKVFALFANSHLPYVLDDSNSINISFLTKMAIANLEKNDNGFFLMVEGGRIDHAGHSNDIKSVITEVLEFDNAISVAYNFYKKYPKETLIIIGSDHETGGLGLGQGVDYFLSLKNLVPIKASIEDKVQGVYQKLENNREKYYKFLQEEVGLSKLTKKEKEILEKAMDFEDNNPKYDYSKKYSAIAYGYGTPVNSAVAHIISRRAGIFWTTFAHTAEPIPLSTIGVGSENFKAYFDNTDIPKTLSKIMGWNLVSQNKEARTLEQSYRGANHKKAFNSSK